MAYDQELATRIRVLLQARDDVIEKRMFGGLAFMVRGHMSCGIVASSLMARVAPEEAEALLREPHVRPMDFTGRAMRGFVFVDAPAFATAATLRTWIDRTTAYAEALPVKAKTSRSAGSK